MPPLYEYFTLARSDAQNTSTTGLGVAKLVAPAHVALRVNPTPSPAGVTLSTSGAKNASLRIAAPLESYGVMPSGDGIVETPAVSTCVFGVLFGSGLGTVIATLATMPLSAKAMGEGVTPGAGLPIAIAPAKKDASGVELVLGLGTLNVAP